MKILTKYKNEKRNLKTKYNNSELLDSNFGAFLATFIIAIPFIFVSVNIYTVFIMRPFLMATLIYLLFLPIVLLFFIFKKSILNHIRKEEINHKLLIFINYLITFLVISLIFLIIMVFIIPKFVL